MVRRTPVSTVAGRAWRRGLSKWQPGRWTDGTREDEPRASRPHRCGRNPRNPHSGPRPRGGERPRQAPALGVGGGRRGKEQTTEEVCDIFSTRRSWESQNREDSGGGSPPGICEVAAAPRARGQAWPLLSSLRWRGSTPEDTRSDMPRQPQDPAPIAMWT